MGTQKSTNTIIAIIVLIVLVIIIAKFVSTPKNTETKVPIGTEIGLTGDPLANRESAPVINSDGAATNNPPLTPMTQTQSGLQYAIVTPGTGATAVAGKTVSVTYVGRLTDGTVFDASEKHGGQPFSFTLGAGQVIAGWDEGVAGMKVGEKRILAIPAELAYGNRALPGIPANSPLIFEVTLLDVK